MQSGQVIYNRIVEAAGTGVGIVTVRFRVRWNARRRRRSAVPAERGVRPGRVASATTATGRWKDLPKTVESSTHATNAREMGPSLIDPPPLSSDRQ